MNKKHFSVVFADDDHDDQYIVKMILSELNLESSLISVYNGKDLLRILNVNDPFQRAPHAIILDLNMPFMDGMSALKEIKADVALREIPVFVLSTSRRSSDRTEAVALGATAFFNKPTNFSEFRNVVHTICETAINLN